MSSDPSDKPDPWEPFYAWFDHGSGRPMALTLPVMLENLIQDLLTLHLRPDKAILAEMFRASGPLGTYGNKIRMAYMFGLIARDIYQDLLLVGKIRNRFAHNIQCRDFDDPAVSGWIKSMRCYAILREIAEQPDPVLHITAKNKSKLMAMKLLATFGTADMRSSYNECIRLLTMFILAIFQDHASQDVLSKMTAAESSPSPERL